MAPHQGASELLWMVPVSILNVVNVGAKPAAIAVSERTGRVFVANEHSDTLSVLDAANGDVLATVGTGKAPARLWVDELVGRVYAAHWDDVSVGMHDAVDGSTMGTLVVDSHVRRVVGDVGRGRLFVASMGSKVDVFDTTTGRVVNTLSFAGPYAAGLAADTVSGRTFVLVAPFESGRRDGVVHMLDSSSGTLLGTLTLPMDPSAAVVDERAGRVFVLAGFDDEHAKVVYVLDSTSGALLNAIAVGIQADELDVDRRTGHVFVVNNSSVSMIADVVRGLVRSIDTEPYYGSIVVDELTCRAFVVNLFSNRLRVIDTSTGAMLQTLLLSPPGYDSYGDGAMAISLRTRRVFVANSDANDKYIPPYGRVTTVAIG